MWGHAHGGAGFVYYPLGCTQRGAAFVHCSLLLFWTFFFFNFRCDLTL